MVRVEDAVRYILVSGLDQVQGVIGHERLDLLIAGVAQVRDLRVMDQGLSCEYPGYIQVYPLVDYVAP